ncbi:glycosyltransferase family 2 protein [Enemella sp. A6]|uniref:glycosyltransferase family 2 protein n=1 Tax=Enemella sp. A6 TaxID=3440152 RepID=UPI003EBC1452
MTDAIRVAVAVITYRRPELLAELLASVQAQQIDDRYAVRIVVVDNDAEGSAREVVDAAGGPFPITYRVEPEAGIPFARQRSVDLCADDDALIFVDDDEQCPPGWLDALLTYWQRSGADVVTGPVHGLLPTGVPAWNRHSDVHSSRGKHRTGDRLPHAYTNNTLVTRAVLDEVTPAFDPAFRFTGSSDLHFFLRVARAGFDIRWVEEAEVTERVPVSRTSLRWLAHRAFRSGAGDTIARRLIAPGVGSALKSIALAVARLGSGMLLLLAGLINGRPDRRIKGFRRLCSAAGSFAGLLGVNHEEYRR